MTSKPIVVRELVGYLEDDLAGNISSGNTIAYQIKGNRGGLDIIENEGLINIQGTGANIVMGSGNMNVQSSSINISTQAYGGGGTLSLSSISSGLDGGHRLYVSADYLNMGGRIETYLNCAHSTLSIKGSSIALNTLGQIDITSNGGINLNSTSSIVLGYVADRTTSNVPMAGVNLTSSGVSLYTGTNNYGGTGSARINTYMNISSNGVTINQSGNIITFPNKSGTIALTGDLPKLQRVMSNLRLNYSQGSVWRFIAIGATVSVTVRIPDDAGDYEYNRTFNTPFEMVCGFPNGPQYSSVAVGENGYGSVYGSEILINCPAMMFGTDFIEGALYYEKLL